MLPSPRWPTSFCYGRGERLNHRFSCRRSLTGGRLFQRSLPVPDATLQQMVAPPRDKGLLSCRCLCPDTSHPDQVRTLAAPHFLPDRCLPCAYYHPWAGDRQYGAVLFRSDQIAFAEKYQFRFRLQSGHQTLPFAAGADRDKTSTTPAALKRTVGFVRSSPLTTSFRLFQMLERLAAENEHQRLSAVLYIGRYPASV